MFMLTTTANPPMKTRRVQSTRRLFTVCSLKMDFSRQGELDFPLSSHPRNTAADLPFWGGPRASVNRLATMPVRSFVGSSMSGYQPDEHGLRLPCRTNDRSSSPVTVRGLPLCHRSPSLCTPVQSVGDFYLTHAPSLLNLKHRGD
ncbi:hypothetical protein I41_55810 (plasmid) [Lacipirellula limnantheis]|uniref:Uncharacterized protein n=1 Tax=Lacipirellula limnantheis TaxID=2528024 RepID=A0A517U6R9_9BACT|nr:hypothetical protein I41_55810 [Lacipirellula limnantheis]